MGPPSQMRYPEIERDLNRSSSMDGRPALGMLASWGPQLASVI